MSARLRRDSNSVMTLSEFYLAYKLAKQGDTKILLLDRSLCARAWGVTPPKA
jgi:hypothetical protein